MRSDRLCARSRQRDAAGGGDPSRRTWGSVGAIRVGAAAAFDNPDYVDVVIDRQHRVIPNVGHNLPQEDPTAFAAAVWELVSKASR